MLIRRDSLMSRPILTQQPATNQSDVVLEDTITKETAHLVSMVMGSSGMIDEWTARMWLQI